MRASSAIPSLLLHTLCHPRGHDWGLSQFFQRFSFLSWFVDLMVGYISHMMLKEPLRSEAIDNPSSHGWTIPLNTRKTLDQVRNHPFATPRGKSHWHHRRG
eukprot:COSAG05_NODE_1603_length_4429_cov_4.856120_4_plen_101_part_00